MELHSGVNGVFKLRMELATNLHSSLLGLLLPLSEFIHGTFVMSKWYRRDLRLLMTYITAAHSSELVTWSFSEFINKRKNKAPRPAYNPSLEGVGFRRQVKFMEDIAGTNGKTLPQTLPFDNIIDAFNQLMRTDATLIGQYEALLLEKDEEIVKLKEEIAELGGDNRNNQSSRPVRENRRVHGADASEADRAAEYNRACDKLFAERGLIVRGPTHFRRRYDSLLRAEAKKNKYLNDIERLRFKLRAAEARAKKFEDKWIKLGSDCNATMKYMLENLLDVPKVAVRRKSLEELRDEIYEKVVFGVERAEQYRSTIDNLERINFLLYSERENYGFVWDEEDQHYLDRIKSTLDKYVETGEFESHYDALPIPDEAEIDRFLEEESKKEDREEGDYDPSKDRHYRNKILGSTSRDTVYDGVANNGWGLNSPFTIKTDENYEPRNTDTFYQGGRHIPRRGGSRGGYNGYSGRGRGGFYNGGRGRGIY